MASLLATGDETQQNVQLLVLLLVITLAVALISRPLRLPYTLVLVVVGLIIGVSPFLPHLRLNPNVVLFLFLPALLFEGAWNVDVKQLTANWLVVLLLAVPGLILSVLVVAALLHWTLGLPWGLVLLLGAMISPTDPIAVLALLRQMGLSDRLRTIVEGESLFNDGVGAAVFELVLGVLLVSLGGTEAPSAPSWWLSAVEVLWLLLGGLVLGVGIGVGVSRLLRLVDDHLIEMTVTVSVAYGNIADLPHRLFGIGSRPAVAALHRGGTCPLEERCHLAGVITSMDESLLYFVRGWRGLWCHCRVRD